MDLHILSLRAALDFKPAKPTYAIQIYSSFSSVRSKLSVESYTHIAQYVFDDNDERFTAGPVTITTDIADSIVREFAEWKDRVEALLVQCSRGENRSPAVAMALNELFNLGHDSAKLKGQFNVYNDFVYRAVLLAGQRR